MGLRATRRKDRFSNRSAASEGPLLLALDTSGRFLNVALQRGSTLLAVHTSRQPLAHARALLPAIEFVLAEQQVTLADVNLFGINLGPGSFTGLRVSMTTIKSFCFESSLPVAGIPAATILAAGCVTDRAIGCLVDARKGELYSVLFSPPGEDLDGADPDLGNRIQLLPPVPSSPEDAVERLLDATIEPILLVGSGCFGQRERVVAAMGQSDRIVMAAEEWHDPSPRVLARLCLARLARNSTVTAESLEPLYVGAPPIHKRRDK